MEEVVSLCRAAKEILVKENNIREVHTPVTVIVKSGSLAFRFVEISTDSSMTYVNYFPSEEIVLTQTICSWVIMWIVVTTVWKPSYCYWH